MLYKPHLQLLCKEWGHLKAVLGSILFIMCIQPLVPTIHYSELQYPIYADATLLLVSDLSSQLQ